MTNLDRRVGQIIADYLHKQDPNFNWIVEVRDHELHNDRSGVGTSRVIEVVGMHPLR